jgi:hypothetical protein
LDIALNVSQRSNVSLIYTQFQKLVVYSNKVISSATATFMTIPRYPQCTGRLQNAICFAPQNGDTVDPINGNSFCSDCLNDVANQTLNLSATVTFYDAPGARPWDRSLYSNYRIFPATNHHSPVATYLPIATIPRLVNATVSFELPIPVVDEDGSPQPLFCAAVNPDGPCSNVDFRWGLSVLRTNDFTLNYHSDGTRTLLMFGGGWLLSRRDFRCSRERGRERDRETERQRDRETERQRDRETERQRERET